MTVIASGAQFRVGACGLQMFALNRGCFDVALTRSRHLLRVGGGANAAVAAVEADPRHADIVDNRFVVDVGDMR
jgi:hypothetical protein